MERVTTFFKSFTGGTPKKTPPTKENVDNEEEFWGSQEEKGYDTPTKLNWKRNLPFVKEYNEKMVFYVPQSIEDGKELERMIEVIIFLFFLFSFF